MKILLIILPIINTFVIAYCVYAASRKKVATDFQEDSPESRLANVHLRVFELKNKTPLRTLAGKFAILLSLPLNVGLILCYKTVESINGVDVLPVSFISLAVLASSFCVLILTMAWCVSFGRSLEETFLVILSFIPFMLVIHFMDPLGFTNSGI